MAEVAEATMEYVDELVAESKDGEVEVKHVWQGGTSLKMVYSQADY